MSGDLLGRQGGAEWSEGGVVTHKISFTFKYNNTRQALTSLQRENRRFFSLVLAWNVRDPILKTKLYKDPHLLLIITFARKFKTSNNQSERPYTDPSNSTSSEWNFRVQFQFCLEREKDWARDFYSETTMGSWYFWVKIEIFPHIKDSSNSLKTMCKTTHLCCWSYAKSIQSMRNNLHIEFFDW